VLVSPSSFSALIPNQPNSLYTTPGTLTATTSTISGLSSVTGLAPGQPCYGPNVPDGALIVTVGSTSITINQTFSVSGTFLISFQVPNSIAALLATAQTVVESYVKYPLETKTAIEYYDGRGYPDLILRRPFVTGLPIVVMDLSSGFGGGSYGQYGLTSQTGVFNGTTTVSGLNTTGMTVGQFVQDGFPPTGYLIPMPTYIASIVNSTTITLTNAALLSGSYPITFAGCFPQNNTLTIGSVYALQNQGQFSAQNRQALLRWLGGPYQGGWYFGAGWGYGYGRGTLTQGGSGRGGWPVSNGGIQVIYTAGFAGQGASNPTVPLDIVQAIINLAQWISLNTPYGGVPVTSESLGKYAMAQGVINQATCALAANGELGTTRSLLASYRDVVF
jgi:hypothetical protein